MNSYTFNRKYITKSADDLIEVITAKLKEDGFFAGVSQGKKYAVNRISSTTLYYTGSSRNQAKQENIDVPELRTALDEMKKLPEFNSNTELLKERISSNLYRKRTPLFGLLTHVGIITLIEDKASDEEE